MATATLPRQPQTESVPPPKGVKSVTTGNPNLLSQADSSAKAQLQRTLGQFGLASLGTWAWQKFLAGESVDQIFLDMRDRPEYKARFPAMDALSKEGYAITEQQYVQLEQSYAQLYHAAGIPTGFYDQPSDFAKLIAGQVSPTELKSRLDMATTAAQTAPTETRQALLDLYGIGPGQLTAYWLDPDKALPILQQQYAAAQTSGTASIAGYGSLTQAEAERVATMGLSQDAVAKGFGQLTAEHELFTNLPGQAADTVSRAQQIAAVTGDQTALTQIENVANQRKAAFGDTGRTFASTQKGITGLQKADQPT